MHQLGVSAYNSLKTGSYIGGRSTRSFSLYLFTGQKIAVDAGTLYSNHDTSGEAQEGDVYTISLNAATLELSYLRNGRPLGVAFRNLPTDRPLYPGISSPP